jgi:hypothetical protein
MQVDVGVKQCGQEACGQGGEQDPHLGDRDKSRAEVRGAVE